MPVQVIKPAMPLLFSPVVEGRRLLNGMDEERMDLNQLHMNSILEMALKQGPEATWIDQTLLGSLKVSGLHHKSEWAKRYVDTCHAIRSRGIPLSSVRAQNYYDTLRSAHQVALETDNELAEKYLKQSYIFEGLEIDDNDRHHYWANPFGAKTGRDRPKGACYCYLPKKYRKLILEPPSGKTIAMIDYGQQDPGVLAAGIVNLQHRRRVV